jgi:hypothetical protein
MTSCPATKREPFSSTDAAHLFVPDGARVFFSLEVAISIISVAGFRRNVGRRVAVRRFAESPQALGKA